MRKFFQTEWQGITFRSFAKLSMDRIADEAFYAAFYDEFFNRYSSWSSLDPGWRSLKKDVAHLIASRIQTHDARVLSIGCGLGYVEKVLNESIPTITLELTETSESPLRWLRLENFAKAMHVGHFPQCLPDGRKYDLIYLSAVDYCFDRDEWPRFLSQVRAHLSPITGRCVIVSASMERYSSWIERVRCLAAVWLARLGLREQGQFWGYLRSVDDQRAALISAGFPNWVDGRLSDGTYWIEGRL